MKKLFFVGLLLMSSLSEAKVLFQYGLNYSSENDTTSNDDYEKSRTFHKLYLGAALNDRRTLFFGWNINSWNSALTKNSEEESYSLLEMGPRVTYFFSDNYNLYTTLEWNPYGKGSRDKTGTENDITGSSIGLGIGYRFKISRLFGLGAGLHYHSFSIKEEKSGSNSEEVSDKISNIMPMLELTLITR